MSVYIFLFRVVPGTFWGELDTIQMKGQNYNRAAEDVDQSNFEGENTREKW